MIQIQNIQKKTINISIEAVSGKCDAKCIYNYDYPPNTVVEIQHDSHFISIKPDPNTSSSSSYPVSYNKENYSVTKALLFSPSLHLFNNEKMDAEIMIEHFAVTGGKKLFVCIPVRQSGGDSSKMLSQIINGTAKKAPAASETTTITVHQPLTFNDLLPKGPFFSYTGKYGEETCDFIVYGKLLAIPFSEADLKTLKDMIQPFHLPMLGEYLFINSKGANTDGKHQDGIYIKCQPTGSSTETTEVTTTTSSTSDDITGWSSTTTDQIWLSLMISLVVLIVLYAMNSFFSSSGTSKFIWTGMPTWGKPSTS